MTVIDPIELPAGLVLRHIAATDATAVVAAYDANRAYLAPWDPVRRPEFYTESFWRREIGYLLDESDRGAMLPLVVADGERVAGRFTLSSIERGVFQNARLGYWVAEEHAGKGVASAAVGAVLWLARTRLGLHRVEASTMIANERSQRVLAANGFERVGLAPRYLDIAGGWQDHYLFQRLLED